MPKLSIDKPRKFIRANGPKGQSSFAVDPEGGDNGLGIITGMAVITRGEALGHGLWIDSSFLDSVVEGINSSPNGVKARFTHPGLSSDGLGTYLGRVKNATRDGDIVRGDLHFSEAAYNSPDGNLAEYVMTLAMDDPEAFGNSIVFRHDMGAEEEFRGANSDENGNFTSPDPDNVDNYSHARLAELRAVDAVDSPAANPGGLFHRGREIAQDAELLFKYSLGIDSVTPSLSALDVDPDRVAGFLQSFLDRHGLQITEKDKTMPKPKAKLSDAVQSEQATKENQDKFAEGLEEDMPPEEKQEETSEDEKAEDDEDSPEEEQEEGDGEKAEEGSNEDKEEAEEDKEEASEASETSASQKTAKDYAEAFGDQGYKWFCEGVKFEDAYALHVKELQSDLEAAQKRLAALGKKGEEPVAFDSTEKTKTAETEQKFQSLTPGQAKFASSIKLPSRN